MSDEEPIPEKLHEGEPVEEDLLKDIATVQQSPIDLLFVSYRHHPDVIVAAVKKMPFVLKYTFPDRGITPALLNRFMNQNGEWLQHVPENERTREACLTAVRQTDKAITYVPDAIKNNPEDPIFYETVIDHEASNIEYVPQDMLTYELILRAFHKNPNIINMHTLSFKILRLLTDYDDAPVPPALRRRISDVHTDQGEDGVCGRHAFSRVILKNFVETFLSLHPTDQYMEQSCNVFLETTPFVNREYYPEDSLVLITPMNLQDSILRL